jgi:hypothetical protein
VGQRDHCPKLEELLQKKIVGQLVKTSTIVYVVRRFVIVFTGTATEPCAEPNESKSALHPKIHFNIILYPRIYLPSALFPSGFANEKLRTDINTMRDILSAISTSVI